MNISEAKDTNTVLRYFLYLDTNRPEPDATEIREACMRLADRANKSLRAGATSTQVKISWPLPEDQKTSSRNQSAGRT